MIGYYVHHQGRGHLHRALAVAAELDEPVTVLSSLPQPVDQHGPWVQLDRDDRGGPPVDPDAGGRLHWAPIADDGLRDRTHQISHWLAEVRPRLLVVDVSVEVALLARLHGVPVVSVVLPGRRDDPAHLLGLDVADALVAVWPPQATEAMLPGLPTEIHRRLQAVGGLSRHPVHDPPPRRPGPRRAVLLAGAGGSALTAEMVEDAVRATPDWEWTVLGALGRWEDDPHTVVRDADVVVTHAGQNAIAEVAAARRPAIVVPQERPHEEQAVTGSVLRSGPWPVLVEDEWPETGWAARLERAAALDGVAWATWCAGGAAARFARLLGAHRRTPSVV